MIVNQVRGGRKKYLCSSPLKHKELSHAVIVDRTIHFV